MIRTRSFGYDRQPVPEIGMGCYRITTDMGVDRPTALATLHRAYERGVRLFDTAPLYGHGEADALLGEAFAHIPDDEIIIGAKLSGPADNLWDYTYDNCMRGFEQTLRHLKRDSVQVLQIHGNPGWRDLAADHRREWQDVFGQGMAYEALLKIREQGGCKYIGVTSHWSPHLQHCLEHAEFDSVEIASHYNLLMNAARRTVLPAAERTNTAVVVATPLFAGRLVSLAALESQGVRRSGDSAPAAAVLGEVLAETGYTLPQLAVLYLLDDPRVTCVIPGSANVAELEENLTVATMPRLPADIIERLRTVGLPYPFLKDKAMTLVPV